MNKGMTSFHISFVHHDILIPALSFSILTNKVVVSSRSRVTWLLPTAYQIPNVIAALHRSCLDVHKRLCFDTAVAINLSFNFPQRDKIRKMVKTHIRRSVFMKQIKPSTRANSKFIVETLLTVQFNPGLRLICVWETGPQKFMHWCGRVEQTGSFPVGFLDKQFLMSCFREHTSNMYSWHTLLAANTLKGNQCWFHWDRGIGGGGVGGLGQSELGQVQIQV